MVDEQFVYSTLLMDRSVPLGNSEDTFSRRALHVKATNKPSEPIPVYTTALGTKVFIDASTTTTPGTVQTLISFTVPTNITRTLYKVILTCRVEGYFTILVNAQKIGSGRTGAAQPNVEFKWEPTRDLLAGDVFVLNYTARSGSVSADVEAYLMAADT